MTYKRKKPFKRVDMEEIHAIREDMKRSQKEAKARAEALNFAFDNIVDWVMYKIFTPFIVVGLVWVAYQVAKYYF